MGGGQAWGLCGEWGRARRRTREPWSQRRRSLRSLAQGTCGRRGGGVPPCLAFPIPLCPGPRLLDGQPGPAPGQPGGQQLVGAPEQLGRHGDVQEARVPNAGHQGLNLHNLPGRVGVGSDATLAWGKERPLTRSGLPGLPLPHPRWVQVQNRQGTWAPPGAPRSLT
jgi:hypothetical protein